MRDFLVVLRFEFLGMLSSKAFKVSTILICLILMLVLFIPSIRDKISPQEEIVGDAGEVYTYGYVNHSETNMDYVKESFGLGELVEFNSQEELEEKISSGKVKAGFAIVSPVDYEYIVENSDMYDSAQMIFEESLARAYRIQELGAIGISYREIEPLVFPQVESSTKILGKDSVSNYMYTYILVFAIYFVIVLYGQMIGTSIASEKSNRAMELLITSTDSKNLIFGKVLGVTLACIIQIGVILSVAMFSYKINAEAWDYKLDFIFDIPFNVLIAFAIFGIFGFLFYAFVFGALGALVSRIEDVSSSSTPIVLILIISFFASFAGMFNTEGILVKVASFLPFSSFMAMFIRIAMGSVSTVEVIISLAILIASTFIVGIFASKIYRMGTLMYGNPVKLSKAIKLLREE